MCTKVRTNVKTNQQTEERKKDRARADQPNKRRPVSNQLFYLTIAQEKNLVKKMEDF